MSGRYDQWFADPGINASLRDCGPVVLSGHFNPQCLVCVHCLFKDGANKEARWVSYDQVKLCVHVSFDQNLHSTDEMVAFNLWLRYFRISIYNTSELIIIQHVFGRQCANSNCCFCLITTCFSDDSIDTSGTCVRVSMNSDRFLLSHVKVSFNRTYVCVTVSVTIEREKRMCLLCNGENVCLRRHMFPRWFSAVGHL